MFTPTIRKTKYMTRLLFPLSRDWCNRFNHATLCRLRWSGRSFNLGKCLRTQKRENKKHKLNRHIFAFYTFWSALLVDWNIDLGDKRTVNTNSLVKAQLPACSRTTIPSTAMKVFKWSVREPSLKRWRGW